MFQSAEVQTRTGTGVGLSAHPVQHNWTQPICKLHDIIKEGKQNDDDEEEEEDTDMEKYN